MTLIELKEGGPSIDQILVIGNLVKSQHITLDEALIILETEESAQKIIEQAEDIEYLRSTMMKHLKRPPGYIELKGPQYPSSVTFKLEGNKVY